MRNPLKVWHTEYGYGFFPGGDPRLFHPDEEGARPEELEHHRKACAAWDAGERASRPDCTHGDGFVLTACQFGLGSYEYQDELWLWVWDWLRWVWRDGFKRRAWWLWFLTVRNWAKDRDLMRFRLIRHLFNESA